MTTIHYEKPSESLKVNLGCGQFPMPGFVNVDVDPNTKADVFHDLSQFPYPFAPCSCAYIEMSHVLEHLPDPIAAMRELHRILAPEGTLRIKVPHFSRALTHYDHRRGFDVTFPRYFSPDFSGGYTGIHFEADSVRFRWFAQPWLKQKELSPLAYHLGSILGGIFDFLGNLAPYATSRLFCYWVGGYDEIEFLLRKGNS